MNVDEPDKSDDVIVAAQTLLNKRDKPPRSPKAKALTILKIAVSVSLIVWLLTRFDIHLDELATTFRDIDLLFLLIATVLPAAGLLVTAERWRGLLAARGTNTSTPKLLSYCIIGGFFTQFLPSTIGGDVVRAYYSWRAGAPKSVALASVGVDRILGAIILVYFASVSLLVVDSPVATDNVRYVAAMALAGAIFLTVLTFVPLPAITYRSRLAAKIPDAIRLPIANLFAEVWAFRDHPLAVLRALLLGVGMQFLVILQYWLLGLALHLPVSFWQFLALAPVVIFFSLIPISINGIGLRENGWILVLVPFSIDPTSALALAWCEYIIWLGWAIVGGVVYLLHSHPQRKSPVGRR